MGCGDLWDGGIPYGVIGTYEVWGPIGWGDPIWEHGDVWGVETPCGVMGTYEVWGSHMGTWGPHLGTWGLMGCGGL